MGVEGVADLRDLNPRPVRNGLTVVGERIIYELRGLACLPLERVSARRKGCAVTRSFSSRITDRAVLEEAVAANHAARRETTAEGLGSDHVTILYHTSEHDRDEPMRSVLTTVWLPEHSSDTLALITAARGTVWREPGAAAAVCEGRDRHDRPLAAVAQPAGTDGGDGRVQRAVGPRHGGAGAAAS